MPRRRFVRRTSSSKKRKLEWQWAGLFAQGTFSVDDVVATWLRVPASRVDNANAAGIPVVIEDDYTLIRSRIVYEAGYSNRTTQANYPWISASGAIAWEGTSDDTNDLGVLPNPYWDQDLDWIWRSTGPHVNVNLPLTTNGGELDQYQSKAMRKLSAGVGILFVFTYADPLGFLPGVTGTTDLDINLAVDARMLFKKP